LFTQFFGAVISMVTIYDETWVFLASVLIFFHIFFKVQHFQ
jgi:hypothetical protein